MKHLIISRHADYGDDDRISDWGKLQMHLLFSKLKIISCQNYAIVSSPAPRALDSSEILADYLGISRKKIEQVPYLWSANDGPKDGYFYDRKRDKLHALSKISAIIDKRRNLAEILIIVSHAEPCRDFPSFFCEKEFGRKEKTYEVEKGKAIHFDLEARSWQLLP